MNPKIPLRHTSNHCPLGTPYQVEAGKPHLGGPIAINHPNYGTPPSGGRADNPWTYTPFHEPLEHARVCYSKVIWKLAYASGLTQSK